MNMIISERASEVIRLLDLSREFYDPNEERSHISGLEHALRLATLLDDKYQNDRANSLFLGFAGLIHDLARPLNDVYHGEVIAEIVKDRVPPYIYHLLRTHGLYQDALMNKTEYPEQPNWVLKECEPWNLQNLALLFCGFEAFTFSPDYVYSRNEWTYDRSKYLIMAILH